jgi:phosphoglycolate phosphatase
MQKADLLIFDLDGTLVRSGEDIAAAVNHTLDALGLSAIDHDTIKNFVGDGLQALLKRSMGSNGDEYLDRAAVLFSDHYYSHLLDNTTLYPDVLQVLNYFRNKKKVIVTNKREAFTLRIVEGLGIRDQFIDILGEDSTPYKKPDGRLLDHVMRKWGVSPNMTTVIGDGINDILVARNAGAISCAFLNGLTERGKLLSLHPDWTCESLSELMGVIE